MDLDLTSKISESRASVSKIKTSCSSTSGKTNPSLGVSSKQLEFNFVEDIKEIKKCVKLKSKVVYQKPTSTRVTSQKKFTPQLEFDFIKKGTVKKVEEGKFKKTTRPIHGEAESFGANISEQLEFDF